MQTQNVVKFEIPVFSFTRVPTPGKEHKVSHAIVNIKDLPNLEGWRRVNVRDPRTTGLIPTTLSASLNDPSGQFLVRNRGMVLAAEKVKQNDGNLEVVMTDKALHGLLDGGNTYAALMREKDTLGVEQYVNIELLEGFDKKDIAEIIKARNTSVQVRLQSILNFQDKFEPIKKALHGQPYAEDIAYKEVELNAEGRQKHIDIREVTAVLCAFDVVNFPADSDLHPIMSYRSKVAVLGHIQKHYRDMKPLYHLLPEFLRLYDEIRAGFPKAFEGRPGTIQGLYRFARPFPQSKFSKIQLEYRVPDGYVYPILAAFRALLRTTRNGEVEWTRDPVRAWQGPLGKSLVSTVVSAAREFKSAAVVGKSNLLWQHCYEIASASRRADVAVAEAA
jgi:hypothetical protein